MAAPPKKSKKPLIFAGIGCLFLLLVTCIGGSIWVCSAAEDASQEFGNSFQAEAARIPLTFALGGIKMSCTTDASGAGTASYFHPSAAAQLQSQACQVTDATIDAFGDANRSQAQMLANTDQASRAEALGLDPAQCTRFTSGSAAIIGCSAADDWQIIHLENLAAVQ